MNYMRLYLVTVLWALLLCLAGSARAHDPQLSGMRILLEEGQTTVKVTTYAASLAAAEHKSKLTPWEIDLAFRKRVHLRFAGKDFQPASSQVRLDEERGVIVWKAVHPGKPAAPEVVERLYPEDPSSRLLVRTIQSNGSEKEVVLDRGNPSLQTTDEEQAISDHLRFLKEGVIHIFTGPDHLCFLLGLILLGGGLRALLKIVTAFTVAHSITLTAAALGIWNPPARLVEPLIALSIIAIALENLRGQRKARVAEADRRVYYAFLFGLVHGFGFAGALSDIGLPRQALGVTLALFNLGVELGQACIVLTTLPAIAWLNRSEEHVHRLAVRLTAGAIGIAGLWWFFIRLWH